MFIVYEPHKMHPRGVEGNVVGYFATEDEAIDYCENNVERTRPLEYIRVDSLTGKDD